MFKGFIGERFFGEGSLGGLLRGPKGCSMNPFRFSKVHYFDSDGDNIIGNRDIIRFTILIKYAI